jgi:hypothetical protein
MTVTPDRLAGDLGWGLAVVFRAYVKAADAATAGSTCWPAWDPRTRRPSGNCSASSPPASTTSTRS